jgi:hypothetical protein
VKEIARVYLSSNGKEFLIYNGNDELQAVVSVDNVDGLFLHIGHAISERD